MPVVPEFLERDCMQLSEVTLLFKYIHCYLNIYINLNF